MRIVNKKSLGPQEVCDVIGSETNNFIMSNGAVVHNSAVIDEANFLEVTEGSKKSDEDMYDAGEEMYNAVMNRMTSRFMQRGKIPGIICLISSPRYPDSFMERKLAEIKSLGKEEVKAFWRMRSLWEAKGDKYFDMSNYFEVDVDSLEILQEVTS